MQKSTIAAVTSQVRASILRSRREPTAIAATEDHLWIVDRGGLVEVVDPLTKRIRKGIPIGGEPVRFSGEE